MKLNFEEALKHITGEKRPKRAQEWMKRFKEASPAEEKKFLEKWFTEKNDLHPFPADLIRITFNRWKKKEKSRNAKKSGQHRKPRLPTKFPPKSPDDLRDEPS
jgi:hypothetical protein